MPPPSQLSITTSSLLRLVKEEVSYHEELQKQESRIQKLQSETGDENAEFMIKQEVGLSQPGWMLRYRSIADQLIVNVNIEKGDRRDKSGVPVTKGKNQEHDREIGGAACMCDALAEKQS